MSAYMRVTIASGSGRAQMTGGDIRLVLAAIAGIALAIC
jgi:hypothetical protein